MQLPEKIALLQKLRAHQARLKEEETRLNEQESAVSKDIAIDLGVVPVGVSVLPAKIPREVRAVRIKWTKPVPTPPKKRKRGNPGTPADKEEAIAADYKGGMKVDVIAAKHNVSKSTVSRIRRTHNLPVRAGATLPRRQRTKIGNVERQEIKAMHRGGVAKGGMSAKSIAKARGISKGRVNRVIYGQR